MIQVIQINRTTNKGKGEGGGGGGRKRRKMNESISIPCVYKKETLDPTFTSIKIQHDVN